MSSLSGAVTGVNLFVLIISMLVVAWFCYVLWHERKHWREIRDELQVRPIARAAIRYTTLLTWVFLVATLYLTFGTMMRNVFMLPILDADYTPPAPWWFYPVTFSQYVVVYAMILGVPTMLHALVETALDIARHNREDREQALKSGPEHEEE